MNFDCHDDDARLWIANIILFRFRKVYRCVWFPSKLSAAGAKLGVKSVPMRTVPSRRSTGRPGPSDDDDYDDDDDGDDDDDDDDDDDGDDADDSDNTDEADA